MKTHSCLFLIFAIFTFPQRLNPSSCSSTFNSSSTSSASSQYWKESSQRSHATPQAVAPTCRQFLLSAIKDSITESLQQAPSEDTEARFKRTLNNPKVLNTLGIIRRELTHTDDQTATPSYDTVNRKLDALTATLIREQLSHTTPCNSSNSTSSSAPASISWKNSYTQLATLLCSPNDELSLNEQNFNAIVTPFLLSKKDGQIPNSFKPAFNLLIPTRHNSISDTCAIDKTNTLVATGDYKGNVQVRELVSGKRLMINNGKEFFSVANPGSVTCLAFSPDSKAIVVGTQTGHITVWSLESGKQMAQRHSSAAVLSLQIDAAGTTVTTAHACNSIEHWNRQANAHKTVVFQNARLLDISNDGEQYAIVHGQTTLIQNSSTNKTITRLNTGAITMGKFNSSGDQFLCISENKQALTVWNIATNTIEKQIQNPEVGSKIITFIYSPEANIIGIQWTNGDLYRAELATDEIQRATTELDTPTTVMALSADGQKMAFVNTNNLICIVTPTEKSFKIIYLHQLSLEQGAITHCSLSADGNYFVAVHSQREQETDNLFIHMFEETAYKLLKNCSACTLELIEDLIAVTTYSKPILTCKEKVQLTPYQSILFRSVPDFIKHVLLRTNKILITKPQDGAPETKEEKQESKE